MCKGNIFRGLALAVVVLLGGGSVKGQSTPTPAQDCGDYQWPAIQSPCPEVQIKQKHNHTANYRYRQKGWDTVTTCNERELVLSCMPYIPARKFEGTYYVDEIPYNPPDTTFYLNYNPATDANNPLKKKLAISNDDDWAPSYVNIAFPFYFFGLQKTAFILGDNGILTFAQPSGYSGGGECPYMTTTPLPWPSSVPSTPSCNSALMRDAIYGVFEDTYTGASGSYMSGNQGIYYGVIEDENNPYCRKIIASWNQIPLFNYQNQRQSYQIVCYEGSNIIEVHVKSHNCCSSTNSGNSLIGIQNATGVAQVRTNSNTQLNAVNGKPAAFYPSGTGFSGGMFHSELTNRAWRFTPKTTSSTNTPNYGWLRLFDDGRPDYDLPDMTQEGATEDTNGYFELMNDESSCRTLTKAHVRPKRPTKYVFYMDFKNANNDWYHLRDTIFVGVDTVDYLQIHAASVSNHQPKKLDICEGDVARMRIDMTTVQQIRNEDWKLFRVQHGDTVEMSRDLLNVSDFSTIAAFRITPSGDTVVLDTTLFTKADYATIGDSLQVRTITVNSTGLPSAGRNKIDTLIVRCAATFISGCPKYDMMMFRVFPNFDTTETAGICRGETYHWKPEDAEHHYDKAYTENTNPTTTYVELHSQPGCDSTVRLALTVYDVSLTVEHVEDCKPIVWRNGKTYSQNNVATAATDTVVLKNRYGCDSIVQLDFVIHPLKALLSSDVEQFTLDNLNATLTDISVGGNARVWKFPNGPDQTGSTAYYSIPAEMEGANIIMIEHSQFGCTDTAKIYIPLNKEHFWVPNAFTPDNPAGNNLFSSVSTKTLHQEMLIYNRRGELVYQCEGVDCSWDGRDMNGNPCVQDAYVYIIRYTNVYEPKKTHVLKGSVTLIR